MVGSFSRRTLLASVLANAQNKLKLTDIRACYRYAQMGNRLPNKDPRVTGRGEELEAVMKRFPNLAPGVARQQEGRQ